MRYVRGDQLPAGLREQVLRTYVHRWTNENAAQTYKGRCPACAQVGPFPYVCGQALPDGPKVYTEEQWHAYHVRVTSDETWLKEHAFRVTKRGTLDARQRYAFPAYYVETENR